MGTKEPKDLGIKIGTPEEVLWTNVLKEAKQLLKQSEDNIIVQQGMVDLAERKIREEKQKMLKN